MKLNMTKGAGWGNGARWGRVWRLFPLDICVPMHVGKVKVQMLVPLGTKFHIRSVPESKWRFAVG
jgi:hypothetical protein